ncbi:folylpolyglutamate synthase [Actinomortierella ambigua]|uniref:Folylpolyglutamate synthase n=1 Tax=Actinomortierella ambigua TaxID=1343610 RepID=A0A9P6QBU7_9FUNG|nr:folylpolyglutamate synthase [Actinomortierella ambigua]
MDLGLERIHRLLKALAPRDAQSPPQETFPVIHVAGTNGKGSICAYLSYMLQASGFRVGRYNSPHLLIPRDTIQINNQPISQEDYDALYRYVQETDKACKIEATSFETLTAVAYCYFAYGGVPSSTSSSPSSSSFVDIAVIEVGVGGRLDATNVLPPPKACVIASIGMDHGALLGNTIDKIAFEKAGIIKTGTPVIVAPQREGEAVYEVVERRAQQVGAGPVVRVVAAEWCAGDDDDDDHHHGGHLRTGGWARLKPDSSNRGPSKVWVPLLGDFQLENAATAIAAIQALRDSDSNTVDRKWSSRISDATIQEGMSKTVWPGRLQWIEPEDGSGGGRGIIQARMLVDGAHNPASAVALRAYVEQCVTILSRKSSLSPVRVHWIMAFTRGKDVKEMFDILFAPFATLTQTRSTVSIVEYSPPEGMPWVSPTPAQEVREQLVAYADDHKTNTTVEEVHAFGTRLQDALDWVWEHRQDHDLVVLCGSLLVASEVITTEFALAMSPKRSRKRPAEDAGMTEEASLGTTEQVHQPKALSAVASDEGARQDMTLSTSSTVGPAPSSSALANMAATAATTTATDDTTMMDMVATDIAEVNQQMYRSKYKKRIAISLTQKQDICRYQTMHPNARFHEINQALGLELERTTILKIVRDKDKWLGIDSSGTAGHKTCFRASRYAMINRATALWLQAEHPDFLRSFFVHGYNVLPMSALARMSDNDDDDNVHDEDGDEEEGDASSALHAPAQYGESASSSLLHPPPPILVGLPLVEESSSADITATTTTARHHETRILSDVLLPPCDYDESTAALHSLSEAAADAARQLTEGRSDEVNTLMTAQFGQHSRPPLPQQQQQQQQQEEEREHERPQHGSERLPPPAQPQLQPQPRSRLRPRPSRAHGTTAGTMTTETEGEGGIPELPSHEFLLRTIPSKALVFAQLYQESGFKASAGWLEGFRRRLELSSLPEIAATLERLPRESPPFYRVITPLTPPPSMGTTTTTTMTGSMVPSSSVLMTTTMIGSETLTTVPQGTWTSTPPLPLLPPPQALVNHPPSGGDSGLSASIASTSVTPVITTDHQVMQMVQAEFAEKSNASAKRRRVGDRGSVAVGDDDDDGGGAEERVDGPSIANDQEGEMPLDHQPHLHQQDSDQQQQQPARADEIEPLTRIGGVEICSPEDLYRVVTSLIRWMQRGSVEYQFDDRQGFYRQLDSLREQVVQRAFAHLRS